MNVHAKFGLFAATIVSVVTLAYAAERNVPPDLSQVQLPDNSCSISCPAGTKWRGNPAAGGGVTCTAGSSPVCQCQDDSKPFARCEAVRKSP
jgi:hypothetical protein